MDPSVGHSNGILAQVGGNLNNNFQKSQMPGGLPGGGMLKLRFDRYINVVTYIDTYSKCKSEPVELGMTEKQIHLVVGVALDPGPLD